MAPTRKRGAYVAVLIFTILPFVPSGVYAQLIAGKLIPLSLLLSISFPSLVRYVSTKR